MIKYIQSFCESLGNYGCYFFCLIDIAKRVTGREYNVIEVAEYCIKQHWIEFNFNNYKDSNNFFIQNPTIILEYLTGLDWSVKKETASYKKMDGDYIVELWLAPGYDGHFARLESDYNSLQRSFNIEKGKIVSYRVFKILD